MPARTALFRSAVVGVLVVAGASAAHAAQALPDPPGYTLARTGGPHDFDFFAGGWTTVQHRLAARGVGSQTWDTFPATLCMNPYLDGLVTGDELVFPTKGWSGFTLRTFDLERRQWEVRWVNSKKGRLESPVVGGFDGDEGLFFGEDSDDGRAIKVRYTWRKIDHDHAHWAQAFSYDGRAWETNWTAEFTRAGAGACRDGRPVVP
jgi:hypothetical protein